MAYMVSKNFFWNEWLCHSNYSFLMGASPPGAFIERASTLGYRGLGLCDYNGVYGLVQAHDAWKALDEAVRPRFFHGIEFSLKHEPETPLCFQETLVLMAQSKKGYRNLCAIASKAHEGGGKKPEISLDSLQNAERDDLVALQPMRGFIRKNAPELSLKRYKLYKDMFGSSFHLLLSRHLNPIEDRWIAPTLELSKRLEVKTLFSQDAYFHAPEEKSLHDVIQAIRLNEAIDKVVPFLFVNEERCLRELDILEKRYRAFADYERIQKNSAELS